MPYTVFTSCFSVCPSPDMVPNAMPSVEFNPWLVGDSFSYVCSGHLLVSGSSENQCIDPSGNIASWTLSSFFSNVPTCGK